MKFSELSVLLPCHSLEDFPVYHEGSQADELLAAWVALWHPALIASAAAVPNWCRIDVLPEDLAGRLLTLPNFCLDRLPAGFVARAKNEGAWLVRESTRDAAVAKCLAGLDAVPEIDADVVADFLALGFCRLQMELLTRQMRYTTNIDEAYLNGEIVAAAQAAVAGDLALAQDHLQHCFDTLYESRKHFYPVDFYLLDITLLAATTLGPALAAELGHGVPVNLQTTGEVLAELARDYPEIWSQLLPAIDSGNACVLGGEDVERELPLLPLERVISGLRAGSDQYEALLGRRPQVYARRRAGLWPALVQLLAKFAYQGALHFTLDDGKFPLAPQAKTRWEGLETSVIDIFGRVPLDAARPESFLALSRTISDSMDTDHVATVAFAHWPGAASVWYDDLRRIARRSQVLGKFMPLEDYFLYTDIPGRLSKFEPDDYRTPYLKQAVIRRQADPISSFVAAHRESARDTASSAAATIVQLISGAAAPPAADLLAPLSATLAGSAHQSGQRALVFNPSVTPRRVGIELSEFLPAIGGAVIANGESAARKFAVVDVPPLGFAWLSPATSASSDRQRPIARDLTLSNEFFEVKISRSTGGIAALYNFNQRGNQLSQQMAFRMAAAGEEAAYTTMRAESVSETVSTPAYGEIVARGTLVDAGGRAVARFRQTTALWAGSRVVHVTIELDEPEEPRADPWNSYYAARFAWPDDTAEIFRGVSLARQPTQAARIEAAEYVGIDRGTGTITILTGGLAYHKKSDARMLDTLLLVRGESARRFELGIGVDLPQPAVAAVEFVAPPLVYVESAAAPAASTGWFFHSGAKNIIATHWEPLLDPRGEGPPVIQGFRARLLETAGNPGRVPLFTFRPARVARQVDFLGETILELPVDNDKITLDFGAHELIELEAKWVE